VIVPPAATGLGVPLFVTTRSQTGATVVVVVVLLFDARGSLVVADTVEVAVIVPAAIEGATFTTTMISAEDPDARLFPSVQVTEVVTVQVHPAGAITDENVVFVGIGSVNCAPVAAPGPLFVIVCV